MSVTTSPLPFTPTPRTSPDGGVPARGAGDRFGRNVLTTFLGNAAPALAALATAPILAHSLAVEGRGQVAAAIGPYVLVTAAATFGVPEAATYSIARAPHVARRVTLRAVRLLAAAGVLATALLLLGAPWLAGGDGSTGSLVALAAAGVVPALCIGAVRGAASGLHRWRLIARERAVASGVRLVAVAVLAASGALTPLTATLTMAVAPMVGALSYLPLRAHLRAMDAGSAGAVLERPRLAHYGIRVWVGSVSGIILARVDQALLAPLAGVYELGLYAAAVMVSEIPLVLSAAIRDVTFASEASSRSDARLTASARLCAAACCSLAAVLVVSAPVLVPLLFGQEFAPAVGVTILLVAAVALGTPGSIAGAGLSARGRPGLRSVSLAIACVVNLGLLALLAPTHGAMGAAWATLVGNLLSSNLNIVFLRRVAGTRVRDFYGIRRADVAVVREAVRTRTGM